MATIKVIPFNVTGIERMQQRNSITDQVLSRGVSDQKPDPPRDLMAQPGARKVILTWAGAQDDSSIAGYRCYYPDENTLYREITDPSCRRMEVSVNSGATPIMNNFFLSSINQLKTESAYAWVQQAALVEAAAPTDPAPPAGYSGNPISGGGGGARPSGGGHSGSGHFPSSKSGL